LKNLKQIINLKLKTMKELKKENKELKERLNSSQKTIDEAEKILENNKLIAEFMGVKESDELYKGHPTFVGDHLRRAGLPFHSIMGNCIDNPPFHSSWDWLMPVVKKIREVVNEKLSFADFDDHRGLEQRLNPYTYNIKSIHKGVVEFIKWYNENK